MSEKSNKNLVGMKQITSYVGRNEKTILKWKKRDNFPMTKLDGRWMSNTDLIDDHQKKKIEFDVRE